MEPLDVNGGRKPGHSETSRSSSACLPLFSFYFVLLGELAIGDKELSKERTEILSIQKPGISITKKIEKPHSSD